MSAQTLTLSLLLMFFAYLSLPRLLIVGYPFFLKAPRNKYINTVLLTYSHRHCLLSFFNPSPPFICTCLMPCQSQQQRQHAEKVGGRGWDWDGNHVVQNDTGGRWAYGAELVANMFTDDVWTTAGTERQTISGLTEICSRRRSSPRLRDIQSHYWV